MAYSIQGRAITGRRQYSPLMTGRPPYFPRPIEEALPEIPQGIAPSQPVFVPKPMIPGDTDASFDPSQGLPEGFSDPSGFAPTNQANLASLAAEKGQYGKAALHGGQALLASTIGMPTSIVDAMLGPLISKGYKGIKSLITGDSAPISAAEAAGSGGGMAPPGTIGEGPGSGLPADMGLPSPGALGPPDSQSTGMPGIIGGPFGAGGYDLADLDMGDFGGGPGGGGLGNDGQGAFGGGGGLMGFGGDGNMGEW